MSLVPVIDLARADRGEGRIAAAREIAAACERIGFFAITGHGVPEPAVTGAWGAARDFFSLPEPAKLAVARPAPEHPYGYIPYRGETLSYSLGDARPPDLKESYSLGPADISSAPESGGEEAAFAWARNIWPHEPAGFRTALLAYYRALDALALRLMRLFALGLDLPGEYFAPYFGRAISALRILNYPDQAEAPLPGQLRAGPHTDYGSLTILLQEQAPGGLEVRGPDGRWHAVSAVPGSFVINLGDLMARWTNDRWRSTLHRVVNPPRDASGSTRRQSMAFFHQPDWDAEIVCIPTCLRPGERPKYPPVLSGPHLAAKFHATVKAKAAAG